MSGMRMQGSSVPITMCLTAMCFVSRLASSSSDGERLGESPVTAIAFSSSASFAKYAASGIAQAFIIGRKFVGRDSVALILGDNIFYGQGLSGFLRIALAENGGATIFGYAVKDPEQYGAQYLVTRIAQYFATQGRQPPVDFPSWDAFIVRAKEYGIT